MAQWLPWVPEVYLARFAVSVMSLFGDPRETRRSIHRVREKSSGTLGTQWYSG